MGAEWSADGKGLPPTPHVMTKNAVVHVSVERHGSSG